MPELKSNTPEGLKAFVHLGLVTAPEARKASGANFSMDCPFCGAGGAMGVALQEKTKLGKTVAPGMWNCFRCGESGNTASLLQKMYAQAKSNPDIDYSELAEDRNLKNYILKEYGVVPSPFSQQWWVPVFNEAGIICNIYRYDLSLRREGSKYAFIGCPGCSISLFNVQTLYTPPPGNTLPVKELAAVRQMYPCRVAEGHWDTMALDHFLREAPGIDGIPVRAYCDVVGMPGANSWQQSWFRLIDKRPLELFPDYDVPVEANGKSIQAGYDGANRIVKMAKTSEFKPSAIRIIEWRV